MASFRVPLSPEAEQLDGEIRSLLAVLRGANTPTVRNLCRDISRRIRDRRSEVVLETALALVEEEDFWSRVVAYELVTRHQKTFASLGVEDVLKLGTGLNSWSSVDCFGMYVSGPSWRDGRIPDAVVRSWVASESLWWRRTALVSTVALSRRGLAEDVSKVVTICARLTLDREDLIVKALSWALRELGKKHPKEARRFLAEYRKALAARVVREVENKLRTGRKAGGR